MCVGRFLSNKLVVIGLYFNHLFYAALAVLI